MVTVKRRHGGEQSQKPDTISSPEPLLAPSTKRRRPSPRSAKNALTTANSPRPSPVRSSPPVSQATPLSSLSPPTAGSDCPRAPILARNLLASLPSPSSTTRPASAASSVMNVTSRSGPLQPLPECSTPGSCTECVFWQTQARFFARQTLTLPQVRAMRRDAEREQRATARMWCHLAPLKAAVDRLEAQVLANARRHIALDQIRATAEAIEPGLVAVRVCAEIAAGYPGYTGYTGTDVKWPRRRGESAAPPWRAQGVWRLP